MSRGRYLLMLALAGCLASAVLGGAPRDPTRPPGFVEGSQGGAGAVAPTDDLRLEMTRTGGDGGVAIINHRGYRVGDEVGGAVVEAIRPGAVDLVSDGRRRTLKIWRARVKRPSRGETPRRANNER